VTEPIDGRSSTAGKSMARYRQDIRDELQLRRKAFHALLDAATADDLVQPSAGTRWNNEQLLFHMLFGYMVVQVLIPVIKVVGVLPRPATKPFALLLNASHRPFNAVNYWCSRLGARFYNPTRMGAKLDRVIASLTTTLNRTRDTTLGRGMYYPTRWDPFFKEYMTLADLFSYPTRHFDFHRRQLTFGAAPR
jgi:hypothetical protein